MYLDAGAIYAIRQWLEYENTGSMRVAIHRPVMNKNWDITKSMFETVTVERHVLNTGHGWMVEFATRFDNKMPVMYGQPTTVEEYHNKRVERG